MSESLSLVWAKIVFLFFNIYEQLVLQNHPGACKTLSLLFYFMQVFKQRLKNANYYRVSFETDERARYVRERLKWVKRFWFNYFKHYFALLTFLDGYGYVFITENFFWPWCSSKPVGFDKNMIKSENKPEKHFHKKISGSGTRCLM